MKNIVSRKDFLNENDSVYNHLKKIILNAGHEWGTTFKGRYSIRSGENDYNEFVKELKEDGIDVHKFMSKYKDKALKDPDFASCCNVIDILLYEYDPLSGNLLNDDVAGWDDSIVLKYEYGYHTLSLGKKYLLQSYKKLEDFYYDCAKDLCERFFKEYVYDPDNSRLIKYVDIDMDKYSIVIRKSKSSTAIIDIKGVASDSENTYQEILDNIQWKKDSEIKDGYLIAGFGNPPEKLTEKEFNDAIERMEFERETRKFNL